MVSETKLFDFIEKNNRYGFLFAITK